ncbi:MAG: hypothetical protein QM726_18610 [Chitinophagaceae bacterium]
MSLNRTLILTLLLFAVAFCKASGGPSARKEKNSPGILRNKENKKNGVTYTFHIDNTVNKNNTVDSVLIILDKYDLSGAGFVRQVFYPDEKNHIIIEDLPVGRYYAEVYVLGNYRKHFSSVIRTVKANRKNKARFQLDFKDTYTSGNASIPVENTRLFAYYKN